MDTASQAPLMGAREHQEDDDGADFTREGVAANNTGSSAALPSAFVVALAFAAGISGLLFGYDTGVISATLVSVGKALSGRDLTSMDKSIITSSTSLFALLASPSSSVLADRLGRKKVILYADILFIVGALLQAVCSSVEVMVVGRCIVGAGVGAASFVVPLYISEVAPAAYRGRLVTTNVLFITMGQMVAYVVGWAFSTYAAPESGWRWMVGLGAVPAVLQGMLVVLMPETPRWLVKEGKLGAARRILRKVNGGGPIGADAAESVIKEIEVEIRCEEQARRHRRAGSVSKWPWLRLLHDLLDEGKHRRALAIACLLQGLQQLCGFNSLMYFSATIFTLVGFTSPTLTSLTVAVTNFLFTLVALGLIDCIGRRRALLYSIPFMILGLLLAALGFSFLSLGQLPTDTPKTGTQGAAVLILVSIMTYVASYAIGLGNVPWMQSELFPLAVRSLGSGIATSVNWSANFAIGLTFLPMMDALSPSWTFLLYAAICIGGYVLVWRIYPETTGLSLEEATALLDTGWGVK